MVSEVHLLPLLRTIDRLLELEGLDPAATSDDDKVDIATQHIEVLSVRIFHSDAEFRESA